MKVLVKIFIFVGILYASLSVQAGLRAEDVNAILKHYGYGHLEYRDGQIKEKDGEEDKDCSPRVDQWGGRMFKTGIWGRDERRPIDIDESSLPEEMRLSTSEKRELRAVGAVLCTLNSQNTDATGFIVDIDVLGAKANRNYELIATSYHALFDDETGQQKLCQFYPDLNNMDEFYDIKPLECGLNNNSSLHRRTTINQDDWCFAKIERKSPGKKISDRHGKLKIDFSDKLDWIESERDRSKYMSAGFVPSRNRIEISGNCSPDDKNRYPNLLAESRRKGLALHEVVLGDCDEDFGSSGGPFLSRTNGSLRAFALNTGDIVKGNNRGDYKPSAGRANYYVKFSNLMKERLLRQLARIDSI